MVKTCPLCKLEKKTKWFYEDKDFVILECMTCRVPMVVTKKHTMKPSNKLVNKMVAKAKELFGENIGVRKTQRSVKDHWHWHFERVE